MPAQQILEADWTWTGDAFESGIRVAVTDDGRIEAVGREPGPATLKLPGRALLPGFVNVHSHAFQRGLRGRGETFPAGAGNFWSWRERMYSLVDSLDPDALFELSRQAFAEMLAAGVTTVGEFHYLHHDASGAGFAMDEAVLAAARASGIRLVLLQAYYRTGGFDQPLSGGQRRFRTGTPRQYWLQMDRLAGKLSSNQSLGAVVHSVRAASPREIREIRHEARQRGLSFHMHVEEQRREIQECLQIHGVTPMGLLLRDVGIGDDFTAVHCTHTEPEEMSIFLAEGGTVCVCPLTEANLGDGVADLPTIHNQSGRISVGTDSNARLCFLEELRWLEYVQRLRRETRGVLLDESGNPAKRLLRCATVEGSRSLGVVTGRIAPGFPADLISVDLDAPELRATESENLLDALIFGCGNKTVASVCVQGRWI